MEKQSIQVDRKKAEHFLSLLDPLASAFTYQTFDDNSNRKLNRLSQVHNGTLDDVWPKLVTLSNQGAGVFVTVNETDLKGRKKENIVRVRAIWFEDDSGSGIDPPAVPHITVESSPGKYHHYFLLQDASAEDFEILQAEMVKHGSDPNAKDISRVLRLPGFCHQKVNAKKEQSGQPFMVRIVKGAQA